MDNIYDVIIVGAGYSGLSAAIKLHQAGKKICVLEARNRVGGRAFTRHLENGHYLDLGAQWIGPTQNRMFQILKQFNIPSFKTYDTGRTLLHWNGKTKSYKGLIPPLPVPALLSLDNAIKKINRLSATIDPKQPWRSGKAAYWDSITLQGWMDGQMMSNKAKQLFSLASQAIFAAHPSEVSMLFALYYIRSGRNFDTLMNIRNGAQEERVFGGADLPARKMSDMLGNIVRLSVPVKHIEQSEAGVGVYGDGFSFRARKIILAIPPAMIQKISFNAPMPAGKIQLWQRMPMGAVWKCYAIYPTPFWRRRGLNGVVASDAGYTRVVFDNSPSDGSKGILMGFVLADQAREFSILDERERKIAILQSFETYFGEEARSPELYVEQGWVNEEWTNGCYTAFMGPHTMTSLGQHLRSSVGNIHFAGTETAEEWNGYMEGAVRAGEREAKNILEF